MVLPVQKISFGGLSYSFHKLLCIILKGKLSRGEAIFIGELSSCKWRKKLHLMNKLHVLNQRVIRSAWRGSRVTWRCAPTAYSFPSIIILHKHSYQTIGLIKYIIANSLVTLFPIELEKEKKVHNSQWNWINIVFLRVGYKEIHSTQSFKMHGVYKFSLTQFKEKLGLLRIGIR